MAEAKKVGTGLDKNVAGALAYVLGPITGIVFYIIEKDPFVKFHAMQSIIVMGGLMVISLMMTMTIILLPFVGLLNLVGFVLWLILIFKAYKGDEWEVPYLGKLARQWTKKV